MKKFPMVLSILALFLAGCAAINRSERNTLIQHNVSPVVSDRMVRGEVLTLSDIIELSRRDIPPQLIIHYLYSTHAIYDLDKPSIARLKEGKVCKEVTDYLLETPSLFAPRFAPGPFYGGPAWYPWGYYPYDAYYGYGPRFYGGSSVVIVGGRSHHRW
ncbi:MAG: hypothetical protein NTZ46_07195 [Verrucomicrobia bacterium]|nr:hypothetical protein [Verrucomicrobiota bacterium]